MGKMSLIALTFLLVFFLLPVLAGVPLPKDISSAELGKFLGNVAKYWLELIETLLNKLKSA